MLHQFSRLLKLLFLVAVLAPATTPCAAQLTGAPSTGGESQPAERGDKEFAVPAFRHIDPTAPAPALREVGTIRFITDNDFPPFSYRDAFGTLTGFNVMLAEALCADLRLTCEFVPRPWEGLLPALANGEGDAILSGLVSTSEVLDTVEFTRPYYRTLARFAARAETLSDADPDALADKRVGVLAGTAHEAFLKAYFSRSDIRSFDDSMAAREALRTGALDALFDDAGRQMFWLASPASRECCRFAGGAYVDPAYFSRPLAMAVKRGNESLRNVLDYGLDRVQTSGDFAKVYRLFFPMSPW